MSNQPFIDKSYIKERTEYAIVFNPEPNIDELYYKEVEEPAKQFEFELDTFQKQAVLCLENHQNVLVAAHTSAGKTVVADYAIAMAFGSNSRVIYTSPIKALSNQKYRDFKQEFNDVGILTGDVQIDTEAKCLIMTTEILLQMLYNKSEVINDLEWVVFDECHYVNDRERGHVWEEVFILLPKSCNLVLLSATVPNVVQFADWLGRARERPTYVVSTSKRPVPLQHYLYSGRDGKSKDDRYLIVDKEGQFLKDNYREAELSIKERKGKLGFIRRSPQTDRNIYLTLIRHLQEKDKLPVICFTLSRNRCDSNLENLMSIGEDSLCLTTKEEEAHIHKFIWRHLSRLKDCDRKLPQIQKSVAMLKRGFGVHHSGILPILKEITEILFSDGYVKVLVATETFAMGVNMPARTVVFDSIEKHDGTDWRDLKPSEYIQMAGRAGRRGKDKTGTVIILCKYDIPDSPRLCVMMQGAPTELVSQFRLTYHMICNLHKTCESDQTIIENFLEQSFGEHHRMKESLEMSDKLLALKSKIEAFPVLECTKCSDIEEFCRVFEEYLNISERVMPTIIQKAIEKNKLSPGRVVAIVGQDNPFESAIVLRINKGKSGEVQSMTVLSPKNGNQFEYKIIELKNVHKILNKNLGKKFDSKSIIEENEKKNVKRKDQTIDAIEKLNDFNFENNYSILTVDSIDPKDSLQLKSLDFSPILDQFLLFGKKILDFKCIKCKDFVEHHKQIQKKVSVLDESDDLEYRLSSQSLQFLPDYKSRVNVLRYLDFMDENLVLKLKGKIGCLISEHELVITEMLMNNTIGNLKAEEIAALLSAFVFQSKANDIWKPNVPQILIDKRLELLELDHFVTQVERQSEVPPTTVGQDMNFDLVEFVYHWASGKSFLEVLEMTEGEVPSDEPHPTPGKDHNIIKGRMEENYAVRDQLVDGKAKEATQERKKERRVQEGIIVRTIQRLDELLKFIKLSAKLMGNKELEDKIEMASQVIRRDIVFCQSLYTISDESSNDKENHNKSDENLSSNFV